jgi:uncharacterized protein (DUF2235 family)
MTNVFTLVELLDLKDPARSIMSYDPGVGAFASPRRVEPRGPGPFSAGRWTDESGRTC